MTTSCLSCIPNGSLCPFCVFLLAVSDRQVHLQRKDRTLASILHLPAQHISVLKGFAARPTSLTCRLVAGAYDEDGDKQLGTGCSAPIRVLANNDVPTGAACIKLHLSLE